MALSTETKQIIFKAAVTVTVSYGLRLLYKETENAIRKSLSEKK